VGALVGYRRNDRRDFMFDGTGTFHREPQPVPRLPQRLRQIAGVVSTLGEAAASDVLDHVEAPLSSSAVRSMLQRLVAKGVLSSRVEGKRYLYRPAWSSTELREALLRRLAAQHFDGSLPAMAGELTRIMRGKEH
jgi:predicted transcriptional regulator